MRCASSRRSPGSTAWTSTSPRGIAANRRTRPPPRSRMTAPRVRASSPRSIAQVAALQPGDTLLFYFAGHGSRYVDDEARDQDTGYNGTILPTDARNPDGSPGDIFDVELKAREGSRDGRRAVLRHRVRFLQLGDRHARGRRRTVAQRARARRRRAPVPHAPAPRTAAGGYWVHLAAAQDGEEAQETGGGAVGAARRRVHPRADRHVAPAGHARCDLRRPDPRSPPARGRARARRADAVGGGHAHRGARRALAQRRAVRRGPRGHCIDPAGRQHRRHHPRLAFRALRRARRTPWPGSAAWPPRRSRPSQVRAHRSRWTRRPHRRCHRAWWPNRSRTSCRPKHSRSPWTCRRASRATPPRPQCGPRVSPWCRRTARAASCRRNRPPAPSPCAPPTAPCSPIRSARAQDPAFADQLEDALRKVARVRPAAGAAHRRRRCGPVPGRGLRRARRLPPHRLPRA